MSDASLAPALLGELAGTMLVGRPAEGTLAWFADGLTRAFVENGHMILPEGMGTPRLVINFIDVRRPRPYRRRAQGTFVISVVEVFEEPQDVLKAAYPLLVRSLSNLLIYAVRGAGQRLRTYFVTLEQGYYHVQPDDSDEAGYFQAIYRRMVPLATSQLVVNNIFTQDLPDDLRAGNDNTRALRLAGQRLDQLNLLPAPFPIEEMLPARDMTHVKRLFNIGGLSYGNLSVRQAATTFWMSASGVNKANMQVVGRDMLLITGYVPEKRAMTVSIPKEVEPRRASVDAIEHWMIYTEHPAVGAIIHVHAWMEGIPTTLVNYPCGTAELAREVAELMRRAPDPVRAVIGLKNHGLTITGRSLADIFERIEGRLIRQVPMA